MSNYPDWSGHERFVRMDCALEAANKPLLLTYAKEHAHQAFWAKVLELDPREPACSAWNLCNWASLHFPGGTETNGWASFWDLPQNKVLNQVVRYLCYGQRPYRDGPIPAGRKNQMLDASEWFPMLPEDVRPRIVAHDHGSMARRASAKVVAS